MQRGKNQQQHEKKKKKKKKKKKTPKHQTPHNYLFFAGLEKSVLSKGRGIIKKHPYMTS